jgi:hypothetical protein
MRGAIRFHRPANQQQAQNHTKNQVFLFGQANHAGNLTEQWRNGNHCVLADDVRIGNALEGGCVPRRAESAAAKQMSSGVKLFPCVTLFEAAATGLRHSRVPCRN